nr:CIH_HP1_G0027770.mRNA.1.CDS.1 [Saccharomyces cerevisiae]
MTVGEVAHGSDNALYTSAARYEVSEVFSFTHVEVGTSPFFRYNIVPFTLKQWKEAIASNFLFINGTDSWATTTIENHDQARSITRFADDSPKYRKISGKLLTLLECSLTDSDQIFSFTKEYEDKTLFAALNFSGEEIEFSLPREGASLSFILGNYDDTDVSSRVLKPWEGRIYLVK